jgi:hypothetical protein
MVMNFRLVILLIISIFILTSCTTFATADRNAQKEFTYDFSIPGKSQAELWRNARDFFAGAYGDSRSVFRVMDEKDGTIIGKGIASYEVGLPGAYTQCLTEYHIRFASKNEKARLQYELIYGVPALSPCYGRPWPTEDGYFQIVAGFRVSADKMEAALKGGGAIDKLKDF